MKRLMILMFIVLVLTYFGDTFAEGKYIPSNTTSLTLGCKLPTEYVDNSLIPTTAKMVVEFFRTDSKASPGLSVDSHSVVVGDNTGCRSKTESAIVGIPSGQYWIYVVVFVDGIRSGKYFMPFCKGEIPMCLNSITPKDGYMISITPNF